MQQRLTILLFAIFVANSCSPQTQPVSIPFAAVLGANPLSCGMSAGNLHLTDLRFYVHAPNLVRDDGRRVPIKLSQNGRWQGDGLTLIDLEDASGDCQNGTADSNALLLGTVPVGEYRGLSFSVGVPFDVNHADPLAANPPLDDTTMHWHWRSGYKFLRLGFAEPGQSFWLHLGSAGCQGTVQDISGCRFPNRFDVAIDDFEPGDTVLVDFTAVLAAVKSQTGVSASCASGPAEEVCSGAFSVFGIDFSNGSQTGTQQLFASRH